MAPLTPAVTLAPGLGTGSAGAVGDSEMGMGPKRGVRVSPDIVGTTEQEVSDAGTAKLVDGGPRRECQPCKETHPAESKVEGGRQGQCPSHLFKASDPKRLEIAYRTFQLCGSINPDSFKPGQARHVFHNRSAWDQDTRPSDKFLDPILPTYSSPFVAQTLSTHVTLCDNPSLSSPGIRHSLDMSVLDHSM